MKLRYFAGLTEEEAAEALGISRATADRHWPYAKAWLLDELRGARGPARESSKTDRAVKLAGGVFRIAL